jgi:hypothetical protein
MYGPSFMRKIGWHSLTTFYPITSFTRSSETSAILRLGGWLLYGKRLRNWFTSKTSWACFSLFRSTSELTFSGRFDRFLPADWPNPPPKFYSVLDEGFDRHHAGPTLHLVGLIPMAMLTPKVLDTQSHHTPFMLTELEQYV